MTSTREPHEPSDPPTLSDHQESASRQEPSQPPEPPLDAPESVASPLSLDRAPHHSTRMSDHVTTATRSPRQRLTWLVMASISVLGISALLAACLYWLLLPPLQAFVGSQLSVAPGQAASTPAGSSTLEATAPALLPLDWYSGIHSGANYRFRLDMPAMLACAHGFFINDFSGMGCDYTYAGAAAQTALQQVELETQVELLSSAKITDRNICPQGGAQVRVGTGADTITGWERDDVSGTSSNGTVTLNLVIRGTPVQLSLTGFGNQPQPFFERYGAIWHHMLTSFTLLPAPVSQLVHPCG